MRREAPEQAGRARQVIADITLHAVDDEVLEAAAVLDPIQLRTLDAIHLATALRIGAELDTLVTYDRRMIDGATLLGLPVASPA